ncbi:MULTISPECIES: IucA/IucC family protein [unclassified Acinetobacter]|uniref:IucA/IucC family protein n=1 Tax=unclassified Acinetobacter TaxID=196816 RepID=UPI0035B7A80A
MTSIAPYQLKINQTQLKQSGQALFKMAIAELAYEGIITLKVVEHDPSGWHKWVIEQANFDVEIVAKAKRFGGFMVKSVYDTQSKELAYQVSDFFAKVCQTVDMKDSTKAYMIKEINHTWLAEAHLYQDDAPTSLELSKLSGSVVDSALRGHPWIVMGKGRFGFGYDDYLQYVPEMAVQRTLPWFAIHKSLAEFSSVSQLTAEQIYQKVLEPKELEHFKHLLRDEGLNDNEYWFLPIHPWQWSHWISLNYATQIAEQKLVFMAMSQHHYLPLQSIRTFADMTDKTAYHIKLPLSILNTAVYRGLPSKRNRLAPQITEWLLDIYAKDQDIQKTGLVLLGELATITATQPAFDQLPNPPYQFTELLGCLWRDSVENYVTAEQQVISQAALIHQDKNGDYFLPYLIEQSAMDVKSWLAQFFKVCVTPLLYWLYRYGIVFSPHGENSLLIHEQGVPKRMVLKDFVDDINVVDVVFAEQQPKPAAADILLSHAPQDLSHFIFTGLFVVHYRYIFDVLHRHYDISEYEFWQTLADVIDEFHAHHPELNERIALFDLKRPMFEKVCLNRVRFFTRGYADDAQRPEPVIGELMDNPISDNFLNHHGHHE